MRSTATRGAATTGDSIAGGTTDVLVLATDLLGTGGIQRLSRSLVRALGDLYGAERIGVVSLGERDARAPVNRRVAPRTNRGALAAADKAAFVLRALQEAERRRPDVVIACHVRLAAVALAARLRTGARVAVWCYGKEVWGRPSPLVRLAVRRADAVVAISRFTAARAAGSMGLPPELVRVVIPGLPPELKTDGDGETRAGGTVLTVARLMPEDAYKGVDTLLLAWPRVLARVPGARLVVVGDGPDRVRLERIAAVLGVGERVRFAGHLTDRALAVTYGSAAVFALPARARLHPPHEGEGFGLVFLEAAAAGLPGVAGRSGGCAEAVVDGGTGVLVDPERPSEVAGAIVRLLADRRLARRLGAAGRARVRGGLGYEAFRARVDAVMAELVRPRRVETCAGSSAS